ncbi:MAG: ABC transporter permease subunit [Chloroflexi bacterium]|nr:ABC transporter permease subunit [Chloroflexota bacterium]
MFRGALREISRYPSAIFGLLVIFALIAVSVYTVITLPYHEAIRLWRGGEEIWGDNPRLAWPAWINYFVKDKRPLTQKRTSQDPGVERHQEKVDEGLWVDDVVYTFEYTADTFPQELTVTLYSEYKTKAPYVSISIERPDGKVIRLANLAVEGGKRVYRLEQDEKLHRKLRLPEHVSTIVGVFAEDPFVEDPRPLKGTYVLRLEGSRFEEDSTLESKAVLYGTVYGWAGTDHLRRDLSIALLWGTPIALSFGLVAAVGTTVLTMIISAVGVWYGGWVDSLIQRITEVNLVLPVLPILIMIGVFYTRSLWAMLGIIILLSIFGAGIKTYRAIFLQVKAQPYIEAARAYGASDWRIILFYMVPRIIPTLIPSLVTLIPSFVFLEASLAVLGLGDPVLPTWGKVIDEARVNGALYQGLYYWMLEPSFLLMVTGIGFAMLGFSLDRIFNPRLREL